MAERPARPPGPPPTMDIELSREKWNAKRIGQAVLYVLLTFIVLLLCLTISAQGIRYWEEFFGQKLYKFPMFYWMENLRGWRDLDIAHFTMLGFFVIATAAFHYLILILKRSDSENLLAGRWPKVLLGASICAVILDAALFYSGGIARSMNPLTPGSMISIPIALVTAMYVLLLFFVGVLGVKLLFPEDEVTQ